ncbi:transposase, partial [Candidatus Competibacter phosphatis]
RSAGMGILERLNRTFNARIRLFVTRSVPWADLKTLLPGFQYWYNERRLHSHLEYRPPATVLADEVAAILS